MAIKSKDMIAKHVKKIRIGVFLNTMNYTNLKAQIKNASAKFHNISLVFVMNIYQLILVQN